MSEVEIGRPEGKTSYSGYAERFYAQAGAGRNSLSASEYIAVVEGFLREFVCMGQCNLYLAAVKDPQLKEAIKSYLEDVCSPRIHEMNSISEEGGYVETLSGPAMAWAAAVFGPRETRAYLA